MSQDIYFLTIEAIGDNIAWAEKRGIRDARGSKSCRPDGPWPSPWAARIDGYADGEFERRFVHGHRDFSDSDAMGFRGVKMIFPLEIGRLYEIQTLRAGKKNDCIATRIFAVATTDGIEEVDFRKAVAIARKIGRQSHAA